MKKLLYSLAALGMAMTACSDFDDEPQFSFEGENPVMEITTKVLTDNSVEYTVTPKEGTEAFAYIFLQSELPARYMEDPVLFSKIDGCVFLPKAEAVTKTVGGLEPNTVYNVYAVGFSKHNVAGKFFSAQVRTSDGEVATANELVYNGDNIVEVIFSEAVVIKDTTKFSAMVLYPEVSNVLEGNKLTKVYAAGNSIYCEVSDLKPGAAVTVGWEADAITDLVGNPVEEQPLGFNSKDGDLVTAVPNKPFALAKSVEFQGTEENYAFPGEFAAFVTFSEVTIPSENCLFTFVLKGDRVSSTVKVDAVQVAENTFGVELPAEAAVGQTFSLIINKGSFLDDCGNENIADTIATNVVVAYGYTVADFCGSYNVSFVSSIGQESQNWKIVDAKEIDEEVGLPVVHISNVWAGFIEEVAPLRGFVDAPAGKLYLDQNAFGTCEGDKIVLLEFPTADYFSISRNSDGSMVGNGKMAAYGVGQQAVLDLAENIVLTPVKE